MKNVCRNAAQAPASHLMHVPIYKWRKANYFICRLTRKFSIVGDRFINSIAYFENETD